MSETRSAVVKVVADLIGGAFVGSLLGLVCWALYDEQFPGLGPGTIVAIHAFAWSCGGATSGVIVDRARLRPLHQTLEAFISAGVAVGLIAAIGRATLPVGLEFGCAAGFSVLSWLEWGIRRAWARRAPRTPPN